MTEGMEAGACSCDYDDGEPSEWYNRKVVVARKIHICCECEAAIKPGEQYERVSGKWDGVIYRFKTCLVCARIRNDYCCYHGMVGEQLWEMLGIDYTGGDRDGE